MSALMMAFVVARTRIHIFFTQLAALDMRALFAPSFSRKSVRQRRYIGIGGNSFSLHIRLFFRFAH